MFSRALVATVVMVATLTTSVMSVPATAGVQCGNNSSLKCCNNKSSSFVADCSPISALDVLSNKGQCTQQTVCCDDNDYNALIVVACSPFNLNL